MFPKWPQLASLKRTQINIDGFNFYFISISIGIFFFLIALLFLPIFKVKKS
jgi:hypothetical protein